MSRKSSFTGILNLLFSLSLQGLVLASGPNIGHEPQHQGETPHPPEQENRVTVLVYNYAHLPMQTLREAEDRASLIFRKAGVEVEWADCPLNNEDPSLYPGCPELSGATQVFLRIFQQTATKVETGGEAFVAARIANIFWSRVEEQAQRLNVAPPRFLAHTVAHELGHLLLGSNSHSPVGIMTARWDAPTVTRICQEGLYFNRQQSELMRSEMRKRNGQRMVGENALLISQR
jgi:hypothetical protein